jgi:hypothetical protein
MSSDIAIAHKDNEVYFRVQDGTHTTEHWCHQGDLLALYEPAGWSVDTAVKPTYALTRRHGVEDHHDRMSDNRESDRWCEDIRDCSLPPTAEEDEVVNCDDCGRRWEYEDGYFTPVAE